MASKAGEKTADGWNKQKTGSMPSLRDPFFFQGLHAQLLRHEKEFEDGQHFPPQNEQPTSSILSRFVANLGNRSAFEFSTYCIYIYIHIIYCSHTYRFSIQLQTLYFFHTERHITSFWLLHLHQSPLWKVWQMIASWVSHPAEWCWLKNFSWPVLVLAAVLGAMHKDVHELLGEIVGWGIWKRG